MRSALLAACLSLASAAPALALGPDDVWLIVNRNVPASKTLAEHYCKKRCVPADHVLSLDLCAGEDITRADYDKRLAAPLRDHLKDKRDKVKVLLSFYGVPLRVGPSTPTEEEKAQLVKLQEELMPLEKKLAALRDEVKGLEDKLKKNAAAPEARELPDKRRERDELEKRVQGLHERDRYLQHAETEAAVDSELSLLWFESYSLRRWQGNLLYWQVPEEATKGKPPIIMTCRLDGPGEAVVRRMIDDSIATEVKGLSGKVYLDARGLKYDPKGDKVGLGYAAYDESLREAAKLLQRDAGLDVTLDDRGELFAPGSCPQCALYCGWYALARYVPSCKLVPGSVAYHIASSEAVSLRDPKANYWCKNLLADGAAVTLGPVAEPYLHAFPKPEEFFGFLTTGKYTLVECYWRTSLVTSWMMVLVGDPLYNPFGKDVRLSIEKVKPSPTGARGLFARD